MSAAQALAELDRAGVFVGYARPEDYADEGAVVRLYGLLDAAERERAGRFRFERDRHIYIVAHALTRTVLARFTDVPAQAFSFVAGPHGRPEIERPSLPVRLRFNLSHTTGLVACAVSLVHDVGVDVECRSRRADIEGLSRQVLAPAEAAALAALTGESARARFFEYWTLKEAYIKAVGAGLSLPLRSIAFDVAPRPWAEVRFTDLDDDAEAWSFALSQPTEVHQLAVAVRAGLQSPPIPEPVVL